MPLESTMICVDNSEFMRNGDFVPTRLQAQQDAVNTVCRFKLRSNPENNVGLLTLANTEVLATLTTDVGKILTSLHKIQPSGYINFLTGIRIAHLSLKHRQSKTHKMRIVVFVGSPIGVEENEIVKLAKRLKKENVSIDIISFGETDMNKALLDSLVNTINGHEGTNSHLLTVPAQTHLADTLISSCIIQGEDGSAGAAAFGGGGSGFEFGFDPNEDPELALALRVSLEEQRQRQQNEERKAAQESVASTGNSTSSTVSSNKAADESPAPLPPQQPPATASTEGGPSEEEMLQQALAMSLESGVVGSDDSVITPTSDSTRCASSTGKSLGLSSSTLPDFSTMTEEEQIAYAMQISMQDCQHKDEPMEVENKGESKASGVSSKEKKGSDPEAEEQDFSEVMSDPAFIQSVLSSLPGVDPMSDVIQQAVGSLTAQEKEKDKKKDEKDDKMEEDKEDEK